MRSIIFLTLLLSYKAVFGQTVPELAPAQKKKPDWLVTKTFVGNDAYMDNSSSKLVTVPWDKRFGSPSMNGADWLKSMWFGSTTRLCSVESIGQIFIEVKWIGKGDAPASVDLEVESAMIARYQAAIVPTITLANGISSQTRPNVAPATYSESAAFGSKKMNITLKDGVGSFSLSVSGRVSGPVSGVVGLRSELKIKTP
jgi:hypothetical protein